MNRDCENQNRNGDCLTRNARSLCDYCDSLLSDDERESREVTFMVQGWKRKALKQSPSSCMTIRKNGTDTRTCKEKKLCALCPYCIAKMSDRQLTTYAQAIAKRNRELREYWDNRFEADEYAVELRAKGVMGIDWNIEQTDACDYQERSLIIYGLFFFGKPCFIHPEETEQAA